MNRLAATRFLRTFPVIRQACLMSSSQSGEWGSGAGKGGGSGGSIRESGGIFGKMEAAREEEYFRRMQREQIGKLKEHLQEEISHHEQQIKQHMEEIERHKARIEKLKEDHK